MIGDLQMKISNKKLCQIIKEELTKVLQEADWPDFTKKKISQPPGGWKKKPFGSSDMPDFKKRKPQGQNDWPDFTKRPRKQNTPKDVLQQKYGIGPLSFKGGASKIVEIYYKLRSKSMPRENPDYGKLPEDFDNAEHTIQEDEDFLKLVAKLSGESSIADLPLPYEEVDMDDNQWGNITHQGYKSTNDVELLDKVAYLWVRGGEINIVFFGRGY